ncbi:uncharacterized protein LOC143920387 [Arctopsyche grandis]|uniref:uncharacterized protein LOC143920387 n=1 Tax=Arctopsyche grandis TaxID=121162 RepID=UPI00406D743E
MSKAMSYNDIKITDKDAGLAKMYNVSNHILQLCHQLNDTDHPPSLFAAMLYAIMLDAKLGTFQEGSNFEADEILPPGWTNSSTVIYKCKFQPVGYAGCCCQLVATVSSKLMLVNLISQSTNFAFSKCYPINRYVPSPRRSSILSKFDHIKELRFNIWNDIIMPARSYELLAVGFTNGSLIGLPDEIIYRIMMLLGGISTAYLSLVSRRFRRISQCSALWRVFVARDCNNCYQTLQNKVDIDWFEKYVRCHREKVEGRKKVLWLRRDLRLIR